MPYRLAHITVPLQMLLSWLLWWPGSARTFPLFPAIPALSLLNGLAYLATPAILASCLAFAAGIWSARNNARVCLISFSILCATDLNRLQIWVFFWCCLWLLELHKDKSVEWQRWVVAGMYTWSGLHKLTPWFSSNFDWMMETFSITQPLSGNSFLPWVMAFTEVLIGLSLLWSRSRRAGIWAAIAMHLYILLFLSPLGRNWNPVVIPWNIAMLLLLYSFSKEKTDKTKQIGPLVYIVLAAVWVLPALNIFNLWPESLSWKMYSNTQREAVIIHENGAPCTAVAEIWKQKADENSRLLLDDWANEELHVPAFNSIGHFRHILKHIQACNTTGKDAFIEVLTVSRSSRAVDSTHFTYLRNTPGQ